MTKIDDTDGLSIGNVHYQNIASDKSLTKNNRVDSSFLTAANPINLSERQQQMLDAIVQGMRYKEIAYKYGISENTVAFHISKLKKRLDCRNSREIISSAILKGLVSIDKT